jgi:hypothetical protein
MTEAEWLACGDPEELFAQAERTHRTSQRVFRLFCAAFWRWQETRLKGLTVAEVLRERVDKLEQWAETGVSPKGVRPNRAPNISFFNARARVSARLTVGFGRTATEASVILCTLIREVFGKPFRQVKVNAEWLTSTVVALARGIYEERAFDRMPILADALQDAGCGNDDVLNHCRDPHAMHVRGCWVVDLVLGKS